MTTLKGEFEVKSWDEKSYVEADDRKLTQASVTQRFTGDIEGEGAAEWLMSYQPDGTARFVGLQRFEGRLDGRRGTVVLETPGKFDGKQATGKWAVIAGSGTGAFEGAAGTGRFEAPMGPTATYQLDLRFKSKK